ncbi:MAG: nucleoside hydrolase [Anaerolineae bacterium]
MRRVWIDTDTASDDAVAVLMALRWPDVHVEGISVVAGNVHLEQGTRNALYTVELCGSDVPVYQGLARPLLREPRDAEFFHGPDGMGGMNYKPQRGPEAKHAVEAIIETFSAAPGEITLVTLGPLSSIATALLWEPRLAEWVKQCYVMGGAGCSVGNITPAAEYNVWCDPEAARILFHSGMKVMMVGWEHCRGEANLDDAEMATVRGFDTPYAHFALDCNQSAIRANREWLSEPGLSLPDPVTMAIALDPAVCTRSAWHYVEVECDSELTRGMTVVDERNVANTGPNIETWKPLNQKSPNVEVCWAIDVTRWKEILYKTLR